MGKKDALPKQGKARPIGRCRRTLIRMRAYVGVTDAEWYRQLASRQPGGEVNFWRPSGGRRFAAIAPGEPFFFKIHHPHNRIVGGGLYSGFAALRISEAWAMFGPANGATALSQMRARVARYRADGLDADDDAVVGCVFVRDAILPTE